MSHIAHAHPSYDPLLTAPEAAKYLGLHLETLQKMAKQRQIASVQTTPKQGSPRKFRLSALNAWVRAHEQRPLRAAH